MKSARAAKAALLLASAIAAACVISGLASAQAGRAGAPAAPAAQAPGRAGAAAQPGRGGAQMSVPYEGPKHIPDAILQQNAAGLAHQATAPEWARDRTLPVDWAYNLAPGVTTKQVSFYVDGGTRLTGTVFYPKDFNPGTHRYPAVVVGHGINALATAIETFANTFASRGFVAMSIDYQSYGYSDSGSDEIQLIGSDPTTDASPATVVRQPVRVKRTNLNNVHEVEDFRAAVSYIQGERGVDPERVGVWATSNGGTVVSGVTGLDGRVKATVIQVIGTAPAPYRAQTFTGAALEDGIQRVLTGQGGETTAGFSFLTNVDRYYTQRGRDVQAGAMLARVRPGRQAILFLPAERDELVGGNRSAVAGANYLNGRGVQSQVITFPGMTHFQAYGGTGFHVGSTLAGDWYVKYLGQPVPVSAR